MEPAELRWTGVQRRGGRGGQGNYSHSMPNGMDSFFLMLIYLHHAVIFLFALLVFMCLAFQHEGFDSLVRV